MSWLTRSYPVQFGIAENSVEAFKLTSKLGIQQPRPFVFICHSLGALILQCALTRAFDNKSDKSFNDIVTATKGIIFLGAPRLGSFQELFDSISRIAAANNTAEVTMVAIKLMQQILVSFASLPQHSLQWKIVHHYEELPLPDTDLRVS